MLKNQYWYNGTIARVVDGDTVDVIIDLGLSVYHHTRMRLARINAPETRGAERLHGLASKHYLQTQIEGQEVLIQTIKDRKGKFGRYIAEVFDAEGVNINDLMVENGYAKYVKWR